MEKLIELLNEYEIEKEKSEGVNVEAYVQFKWEWVGEGYLNKGLTRFDETDQWEGEHLYGDTAIAYLISKSFGFIKWLVENDKIDLENLQCVFSGNINKWKTLMEETDGYERYEGTEYEATESLIMLLSIQDNPIDFLVSILK